MIGDSAPINSMYNCVEICYWGDELELHLPLLGANELEAKQLHPIRQYEVTMAYLGLIVHMGQ